MNEDEKELLKNMDLLLNFDLMQNESEWDVLQSLEQVQKSNADATDSPQESIKEDSSGKESKIEDLNLDEEE